MLLAAICVLMFYWSFLASPVLPEELFPSSSSALSTCVQSCICCVVIFICLICLLKRAQKVERISRVATVVSLVVLCMLAVALIILSLVGVEPPNVLFIAFPVAVGFCGFFVTLRIAKVMRSMDGGKIVIAVLGSMPLGLFVGVAVPSVFPLAGLTTTSSCYPMLIVAGVISLSPFGLSNRQEADFASRREGATAKYMPLVVMLLPARTDTRWFHDYILGKAEVRFVRGRLKFGSGGGQRPIPVDSGCVPAALRAYGGAER